MCRDDQARLRVYSTVNLPRPIRSHVIVDDYAPDNPIPLRTSRSQTIDLVVAPATANIMAKFTNGVADDFLTSTYLAATAPVLIAPAMNTLHWEHPATPAKSGKIKKGRSSRRRTRCRRDGLWDHRPGKVE